MDEVDKVESLKPNEKLCNFVTIKTNKRKLSYENMGLLDIINIGRNCHYPLCLLALFNPSIELVYQHYNCV